ncbi:MAG: hypothetical protein AB1918_03380 [Pseudomonadota bacterium]
MTSYRAPGTIEFTLSKVLGELSPEDVERATGKKHDSIARKSNPDQNRPLSFAEAVALDAMLKSKGGRTQFAPLLEEMTDRKVKELAGLRPIPNEPLASKIIRLNVEVGHLAEEVERAQAMDSPGGRSITPHEWRDLLCAAENVKAVVNYLMDIARARSR